MKKQSNCYLVLIQVLAVSVVLGAYSAGLRAQSIPKPKFFGVYAFYDGKLTELKRNPHSNTFRVTIGGQDVIQSLSDVSFADSKKLTFIIFSPRVANLRDHFNVHVMATIRNAPQPSFHLRTQDGWQFRVAPVSNEQQMVQLIGPERGTSGGRLALLLDDGFYDYQITGRPPDKDSCVERQVSYMGPSYPPCRQGAPSAASPTNSSAGTAASTPSALPVFRKGESYDQVRRSLIDNGWKPMSLVPAGHCGWDADMCPKVPEVIVCAGAGAEVPCFYAWRKDNALIQIVGGGEGAPQAYLRTIRCKAIVRGDPQYVNDWKCVR